MYRRKLHDSGDYREDKIHPIPWTSMKFSPVTQESKANFEHEHQSNDRFAFVDEIFTTWTHVCAP